MDDNFTEKRINDLTELRNRSKDEDKLLAEDIAAAERAEREFFEKEMSIVEKSRDEGEESAEKFLKLEKDF